MKAGPSLRTRKQREFRTRVKRVIVGIFLLIFISSVVGVALVSVSGTAR